MSYIIDHGADVFVEGRDDTLCYDRVEILDSGMVVCINKGGYQKDIYAREKIKGIHTHTNDEEESADWW